MFQKLQNITKYLSIASLSLGVFNTFSNQITIQTLRDNLEQEKDKNTKLISDINNLVDKNINNNKLEDILNENIQINNNKLELLNNKINQLIENKLYDNTSVIEVNNNIKEINSELTEIINKIDDSLNNNFIGLDIISILQNYYSNLNYFQSFALTHLSGFVFVFLSLISLISIYFGDYLIEKFNIDSKYPKIYKYIQLRRKFQRYYLILDITIIFSILLILSILNIMLFVNFTF